MNTELVDASACRGLDGLDADLCDTAKQEVLDDVLQATLKLGVILVSSEVLGDRIGEPKLVPEQVAQALLVAVKDQA